MITNMELFILSLSIILSLVIGPCIFIAGFKTGVMICKSSLQAQPEPEKAKPVEVGQEFENPFIKKATI